ncbi:16S rRNA (cytosine(967)-C(5))-methyltransferase RsmB [Congregibacter litoralis]|uniref:16S rRNA (cytosine(967)-C(5))-methyltransferase n=1 Tax=Congregibacter litoralis KT71 TaxID=314285 RepID=A4A936_9GAMM|nr:16S rRNA (cytosine(967)-C(5))-methyltransferase RsmB [Congregibacter litoralis]EAQ97578.1 methyltransferase [Congregibacter litoralis KT71]
MKPGAAVRACAARIIAAVVGGESLDRSFNAQIEKLPERDRALCREISYGTLRQFHRLDALLAQLLQKPLRAKDRDVHALALAGLYQLTEMRVPAHAAVSATVDAASVLKKRQLTGLLNAVLRRFQRDEATLTEKLTAAQNAAHPDWLWAALGEHWPDYREEIAAANNSHPPMTLRVNLSRGGRDEYREMLDQAGIASQAGQLSPAALTLDQAVDVTSLPGFEAGLCSVQDEAAQMAAQLLAPRAGERILDACAAPGGKTGHLLELQRSGMQLTAMDISEERLHRVRENLDRLGLEASLLVGDGARPSAELKAQAPFDAMLLDVPCSASGVIRRHPDVKILRRPEDTAGFARQQNAILDGLWPLLAPGGRLLYVSCSIMPGENSEVVAAFVSRHADAREEPLAMAASQPCAHGRQLLPRPNGSDGLYFAMLYKSD